jgi:predicted alpha/beta-hydrolase family hydrolase
MAWVRHETLEVVVLPIPINLIARWLRAAWYAARYPIKYSTADEVNYWKCRYVREAEEHAITSAALDSSRNAMTSMLGGGASDGVSVRRIVVDDLRNLDQILRELMEEGGAEH